jgi:hypothetical protein
VRPFVYDDEGAGKLPAQRQRYSIIAEGGSMSQQTIQPTAETKMASEGSGEKRVFPKIVPAPQVVVGIAHTGQKRIGTFVSSIMATWLALPAQRKRVIKLLGLSVLVSVTTSLIARGIARLFAKKPGGVAAR